MFADKQDYSFSTCWNIRRHSFGADMIDEIRGLGFRRVELNYNVTDDLLRTIEPMIERGDIAVSSVHNTFPHLDDPDYGTDSVLLGFEDGPRRDRSIELLVRSAEHAHRYGASAVVVHPGEVPIEEELDRELKTLWRQHGPDSATYQSRWSELLERREAAAPAYLARIGDSLEAACEQIARRGYRVRLGLETRSRCYQIPTLREARLLCDRLAGAPVGLWYDIGHGMMMGRMGLYDPVGEALAMKNDIVGVHIHETVGLADHWCPYVHSGDPDGFDVFLPLIAAAPVRVYELKAACAPDEIERSHRLIASRIAALGLDKGELKQ
ncbi:sugar phosphate isomerase/epimerase family protein [Paenibacillus pasadenensis]|uniref:sugar phosphate isomerase/epimerase family protein n=1 Tax=Paenibacillus pasadenensis TaxID=217090 RepID=UPI000426F3E9|nr:TIM barrel protein [Paenibacillus pasadenensis]